MPINMLKVWVDHQIKQLDMVDREPIYIDYTDGPFLRQIYEQLSRLQDLEK